MSTRILIVTEWNSMDDRHSFYPVGPMIKRAWSSSSHGLTVIIAEIDEPASWTEIVKNVIRTVIMDNTGGSIRRSDIEKIIGVWRLGNSLLAQSDGPEQWIEPFRIYEALGREAASQIHNKIEQRERKQLAELLKKYPDMVSGGVWTKP